jgi:tetratricopeptide (TPR) repeat protein
VDELARGLVADLAGRPGDRLAGLAARMTRSIPAMKAYLAGHRALQRGDMRGAVEAFESSLELDSGFVLARYEFALAAAWEGHGVPARQAVVQAVRDSAALPARERRLLVGLDAFLRGDLERAEDAYRRVLGEYPDELEANYMLGETLFHLGPIHGQSMQVARAPFERVLTVDPDHLFSLHHLANLALMRGEYAAADSLQQRALATGPERWFVVCLRTMQAMASGDPTLWTAAQSELQTVETLGLFCSMMTATWIFQDPAGARWVVEALTAPHRPAQLRATGHALLAYFEAARGRPSQVERQLVEVDRLYPVGASHRAYLSLLPLAPSDRNLLEERLREVEGWDVESLPTGTTALMMPPVEVQPAIRLYLLAALSVRLGRDSAALAYADRLEQVEWTVGGDLSATLVPGIRAAVAAAHGEAEEALRLLETAPFRGHYEEVYSSPVISMAAERYLMAELLDAVGRSREALGWFASLGKLQAYEIAYVAPAHLRRAQIHERLGEPEEAAEHYARFVELWQDCDPELRPLVEEAEARLAQLRERT